MDPVAVIAVFEVNKLSEICKQRNVQEIHVNDFIFVNVFGEALFNDGVTVVSFLTIQFVLPKIDLKPCILRFCTSCACSFCRARRSGASTWRLVSLPEAFSS